MAIRTISTLSLWIFVFAVLWFFQTDGAVALLVICSAFALREFYRLQAAAGKEPFSGLGVFFGILITAAPWIHQRFGLEDHAFLPLAVVVFAIRILAERTPEKRVDALSSTLFGLVYVALLMQYLVRIVTPLAGPDVYSPVGRLFLVIWVVIVAKLCDTGALITGLLAGRHAMAPQISPKKTWEGAMGGIVLAVLAGAGGAWLASAAGRGNWPRELTPLRAGVIALPIAIVGIVSDLVESIVKRHAAIKDSGSTVPGIGGILDVVDSLLLTAPVAYFLLGLR